MMDTLTAATLNRAESGAYEALKASRVPEHMHDGLVMYLVEGRETGGFLKAVLSNDLVSAVRSADDANISCLPAYVSYLWNFAPALAWGSPAKVKAWIARGGLREKSDG
jgi:hypothetical protein